MGAHHSEATVALDRVAAVKRMDSFSWNPTNLHDDAVSRVGVAGFAGVSGGISVAAVVAPVGVTIVSLQEKIYIHWRSIRMPKKQNNNDVLTVIKKSRAAAPRHGTLHLRVPEFTNILLIVRLGFCIRTLSLENQVFQFCSIWSRRDEN